MKMWLSVLLAALAVLGVTAWLWLQDEPLAPQAKAWLQVPHATAGSLAYEQLLGLDAPAGEDPQAVGRQLLQAHRQKHAQPGPGEAPLASRHEARIALPGAELCTLAEAACLPRLRQEGAVAELLARHAELLQRYARLLALSDYRTLSPPSMDEPLANFTTLERANRLRLAQALALAEDARGAEALGLLQGDVRQLRQWLARADNLILKMLLVRQLDQDLDAIAVLYRAGLLPRPAAQPALSEAERGLEAAMQREFALVGSGLLGLQDNLQTAAELGVSGWRLRLMYKAHMTVNDMLPDYQRVAANSRLDSAAFVATLQGPSRSEPSLWSRVRNPVGTILGSVAMPDYNQYLARLHDLDAKLALFNALGQAVAEADNPYWPGQQASWNAQRQAYCFSGPLPDEQGVRCLPWAPPPQQ